MKLEATMFSNVKLVIDEFDIPVAVQINGEIRYKLYDHVMVDGDDGYIGPGLEHGDIGRIMEIRRDETDYFYGVLLVNGEFGYTKDSRLMKVEL